MMCKRATRFMVHALAALLFRRSFKCGLVTLAVRATHGEEVARSCSAHQGIPWVAMILMGVQLLLPAAAECAYLFKIIAVQPGTETVTTGSYGATGLSGCTPVAGTKSAVAASPVHGTVTLTPFSNTKPGCGTAVFTGVQANYTWTDTAGMPGSGSDYFRIMSSDASGNQTDIVDVTIFLGSNGKAGCLCSDYAPDPSAFADPTTTINALGQGLAGDPIDITTGNVSYSVTDYRTGGQNTLAFIRTYNSNASVTGFARSTGGNWRSNFDRYVDILSANTVNVERANGQVLSFYLSGTAWAKDSDVDVSLVHSGNSWTLTDENDTVETYTTKTLVLPGIAQVSLNAAQLTSIKYRNGYAQTISYNAGNQLTSVTDSYGRTLSFTYGPSGLQSLTTPENTTILYGYSPVTLIPVANLKIVLNPSILTSVTYPTSPASTQTYLYEHAALPYALTGVIDENGNRFATWTYDNRGRGLTSQMGSGANLTTVAYNDTDGSRTVTNALGQQELFTFTTLQNVPKVSEVDRQATATTAAAKLLFTYDANGYLTSRTDWNGNKTTYTNNAHGLPTAITEGAGSPVARTTTLTYDSTFTRLPKQIVTPGLTTGFTYDANGNVLTRVQTDTTTATVPYKTGGQIRTTMKTWSNSLLASAKTPNGNTTSFTYDSTGALTSLTNALGHVTQITQHTGGGLPQIVIDPNGVSTTLGYDARQRFVSRTVNTAAGPLTTGYGLDPAGNLASVTMPDGSGLLNSFDDAHRLTGTTDLFGQSIAYVRDALGNVTQSNLLDTTGTGQFQRMAGFDAQGRKLQDIGGAGQTSGYSLDANGNVLKVTDPLGRITIRAYDALNRLNKITDPATGVTGIAYDPHDRPVSVTDANGNATAYTYDGFGDVIQEVSPDRGTTIYHYDSDGNLTQRVDGAGVITNFAYDALDRPLTKIYPADTAENVTYRYDEPTGGFSVGRLTSVTDAVGSLSRTYDERGNLLTETRVSNGTTLMTSYSYDAASRIASITYPSGWSVAYTRDAMGRVVSVSAQSPDGFTILPVVSSVTYQPFGPLNGLTFGNGVQDARNFDQDYRLTALADAGTNPVQGLGYSYDNADNVQAINDAVTPGNSQTFGYDMLDRLTDASGAYGTFGWTYDKLGNRLNQKLGGVTTTYTYPAKTNRLASWTSAGVTQNVGYSATGNIMSFTPTGGMPTTLTYNKANRLATVTTPSQSANYVYDVWGQRQAKSLPGSNPILYSYSQNGTLLEETDGSGTLIDYLYLGTTPVAELQPLTGAIYYLHNDRLGTPQLATDSSQNVVWIAAYQPFGDTGLSTFSSTITQNLRFPGQYFDGETGFSYNLNRDYIPNIGRYLETDPIGLVGGMNTYRYASANPIAKVDPQGTICLPPLPPGFPQKPVDVPMAGNPFADRAQTQ